MGISPCFLHQGQVLSVCNQQRLDRFYFSDPKLEAKLKIIEIAFSEN